MKNINYVNLQIPKLLNVSITVIYELQSLCTKVVNNKKNKKLLYNNQQQQQTI